MKDIIENWVEVWEDYFHVHKRFRTGMKLALMTVLTPKLGHGQMNTTLLGSPSSGKSSIIRSFNPMFQDMPTVPIDNFTAAGLVSGKLKPEEQLLTQLDGKTLSIHDTALLAEDDENTRKVLNELRVAWNVDFHYATGSQGVISLKSSHNSLVGATHDMLLGSAFSRNLGERFLRYDLEMGEHHYHELHSILDDTFDKRPDLERILTGVTNELVMKELNGEIDRAEFQQVDDQFTNVLLWRVAEFAAQCRTKVSRQPIPPYHVIAPVIHESPSRVYLDLKRVLRLNALFDDRQETNDTDLELGIELALDNIPTMLKQVLLLLLDAKGAMTQSEVEAAFGYSPKTLNIPLNDLVLLRLVEVEEAQGLSLGDLLTTGDYGLDDLLPKKANKLLSLMGEDGPAYKLNPETGFLLKEAAKFLAPEEDAGPPVWLPNELADFALAKLPEAELKHLIETTADLEEQDRYRRALSLKNSKGTEGGDA